MYLQSYALDYRRNLAYTVASWILISRGRRFDPPYFGDRRHCGSNQTCHWARSVGDRIEEVPRKGWSQRRVASLGSIERRLDVFAVGKYQPF